MQYTGGIDDKIRMIPIGLDAGSNPLQVRRTGQVSPDCLQACIIDLQQTGCCTGIPIARIDTLNALLQKQLLGDGEANSRLAPTTSAVWLMLINALFITNLNFCLN